MDKEILISLGILDSKEKFYDTLTPDINKKLWKVFSTISKEINAGQGDFSQSKTLMAAARKLEKERDVEEDPANVHFDKVEVVVGEFNPKNPDVPAPLPPSSRPLVPYGEATTAEKSLPEDIRLFADEIIKEYLTFGASLIDMRIRGLLDGRPTPGQYLAEKLGDFLFVDKQDRSKLVTDKIINWIYTDTKYSPPIFSFGGEPSESDFKTEVTNYHSSWAELLMDEKQRLRLVSPNEKIEVVRSRPSPETLINRLHAHVRIEAGKAAESRENARKLFATYIGINNDVLPSSLEYARNGYRAYYAEYVRKAKEAFMGLSEHKYNLLDGSLFAVSTDQIYDFQPTAEPWLSRISVDTRESANAFEKLLNDNSSEQNLINLQNQHEKTLDMLKSLFSMAPVLGDLVNIGVDAARGDFTAMGHDILRSIADVAVVIPGGELVAAGLYLGDAGWSEGEAIVNLKNALASGNPERIAAAKRGVASASTDLFLCGLSVVDAGARFKFPSTLRGGPIQGVTSSVTPLETHPSMTALQDEAGRVTGYVAPNGTRYRLNPGQSPATENPLFRQLDQNGKPIFGQSYSIRRAQAGHWEIHSVGLSGGGVDGIYSPATLKYMTRNADRLPTLYFEDGDATSRIRLQHADGVMIQPWRTGVSRLFVSGESVAEQVSSYLDSRSDFPSQTSRLVRRINSHLNQTPAPVSAEPTVGSYQIEVTIERGRAVRSHFSGGLVQLAPALLTRSEVDRMVQLALKTGNGNTLPAADQATIKQILRL